MKRTLILVSLVGIAAVAGVGYLVRGDAAEATSFRLVAIERGDVVSTVSATGTLDAVSTVQVGTQVSGQIAQLYADFNDHVRRGQLIAQLDTTLLAQAVIQAQAEMARAQADLTQKEHLLTQSAALKASNAITDTEYRTADYNAEVARASIASARASLERAEQNLQYAAIRAPINGIVIERNVDVGQTVAASLSAPQLFLIAEDLSRMQILVAVDESDIGLIEEGQTANFTVQAYANRVFLGTVNQVRMQSTTSENVVNYTVVVSVSNSDGALLPGMTATVDFEVAKATDVLMVANAALRFQPTEAMTAALPGERPRGREGTQLWYLDATGATGMILVRTGLTNGTMTEITPLGDAGLPEGARAIAGVVSGQQQGAATTTNPFQNQQEGQTRGPRGPI